MSRLHISKKFLIIAFLIVGVSLISYGATGSRDKTPKFESFIAKKGELIQDVSVTGSIKPKTKIELALEMSGKIDNAPVMVGDRVEKGTLLLSLSNTELTTQLRQAEAQLQRTRAEVAQYQAAVDAVRAELEKLQKGARKEETALLEVKASKAEQAVADAKAQLTATEEKNVLERGKAEQFLRDSETNFKTLQNQTATDLANVYKSIPDILEDAYTKADDALHKQIDEIFTDDDGSSPKLSFNTSNFQAQLKIESGRGQAGKSLAELRQVVDAPKSSDAEKLAALNNAKNILATLNDFLLQTADILNYAINLPDAALSTYKTNVSAARGAVSAAITAENAHIQKIDGLNASNQVALQKSQAQLNDANEANDLVQKTTENERIASQSAVYNAEGNLKIAQQELALSNAGARQEDIDAAKSKVAQAEASLAGAKNRVQEGESRVEQIQAQLQKAVLYSPIAGIVTRADGKVGELATAQAPLVSVISDSLSIETFIPEVDSAKVSLDDEAVFTLDAYGSDVKFRARVTAVDPAETTIDGVSAYKTTLELAAADERIKSGMTVNIEIQTDKRDSVIGIPQRAVLAKDGEKFVRIVKKDATGKPLFKEEAVITGLQGSDGRVEIISGLVEGDEVVIFMEDK